MKKRFIDTAAFAVFTVLLLGIIVFFATHDRDLNQPKGLTISAVEPGVYTDENSGIVYELAKDPDNDNHGTVHILEDPNGVLGELAPQVIAKTLATTPKS